MSKATGALQGQGRVDALDPERGHARLGTRWLGGHIFRNRMRGCVVGEAAWRGAGRGRFFATARPTSALHEALNLAAVWKLPVIFVCENNLYMEDTPIRAVTAVDRRRPTGPRSTFPAQVIDGNDAAVVVRDAVARGRRHKPGRVTGPTVIEAQTLPALRP